MTPLRAAGAVILIGGLGTRLRPLTLTRPKALMPVLNRPFLRTQLDLLTRAGIKHIVLAAGAANRPWKKAFERLAPRGTRLTVALEPQPLGTGGAIRFGWETLRDKTSLPTLVLNGDALFTPDIPAFRAFHARHEADASLLLTRVLDATRFGVVLTAAGGRVRAFLEKPRGHRGAAFINAGAYWLTPGVIQTIPRGVPSSVERDIFPRLLRAGKRLFGFKSRGYWNDIGTIATYLLAHRDLLRQEKGQSPRLLGRGCVVARNAAVTGFFCAGAGCRIGAGAVIKDTVLHEDVHIDTDARITGAVIGRGARIGACVVVGPGSAIGDRAVIPPHSKLGRPQ